MTINTTPPDAKIVSASLGYAVEKISNGYLLHAFSHGSVEETTFCKDANDVAQWVVAYMVKKKLLNEDE